jgi:alpha 1,6-mannosyltransferase
MLADGGVYSDMDTSCLKPIDEWIPEHLRNESINAIVGVEYDDNTYRMFVRPISFSQWTLMSKPGHPLFERVVARVVYHLEYLARIQNTSLGGLKVGKKEVLEATGPGAFTDAVMETLSNNMGRKVDWEEVSGLKEPKLFGDVLILPINGFGGGQKHSHSGNEAYGERLVQHHFGRSWYTRPADPAASTKS